MSFQFPFCFESCCYLIIYIYVCIMYISLKFVVADNIESDSAYCCFFCLFVRSLLWNVLLTFNDELIIRKTKQILIFVIFPTSSTIPTGLLCILCIFTYRSLRKKNNKKPAPRMGQIRRNPVEKVKKSSSSFERTTDFFGTGSMSPTFSEERFSNQPFKVENPDGSDFHGVIYIYTYIYMVWYCWWFRNPVNSPVDIVNIPLSTTGIIHPNGWLALRDFWTINALDLRSNPSNHHRCRKTGDVGHSMTLTNGKGT